MKAIYFLTALLLVYSKDSSAQASSTNWNHKRSAVVLTYDDALNVHLDNVIPLLDSLGFKGSFYLSGFSPGYSQRIVDWRKAAANGHELGNHTFFHPCISNTAGREWVQAERRLENYSLQRIREELKMNNILLQATDGKTQRSFAYPCGDMRIGDSFYLDKTDFLAARSTRREMPLLNEVQLYDIGCYSVNGQTGEELIRLVKEAMAGGRLIVFLFHGVGGEHAINVSLEAHRSLLHFLKKQETEIWVATLLDVANYVKKQQPVR